MSEMDQIMKGRDGSPTEAKTRVKTKLHGRRQTFGQDSETSSTHRYTSTMSFYTYEGGRKALGIPGGEIMSQKMHENNSHGACSPLHAVLHQLRPR